MAREQRRLAAIVAADVIGYSRLMGRDESGTLARLTEHRKQRFEPTLARHGGRLVKLTGDGALAEFPSAVDALSAAIEFQQAMAEANRDQPEDTAIVFRVGLHLGDLIVDGDDLYGDGVNVAARLEAEAPAGGIVVSRAIREAVEGRLKAKLRALGELTLKNIERPIRAFRVEWDAADWQATVALLPKPVEQAAIVAPALALPDKPSIAVLPFQNMSGDPEQEYFADGMVEDIITALSRFKSLFVIARNSSFTYKGKAVDIKQVGRELGVRYVLEGSVRKAGGRVRITGQLINSETGAHLWADRFEGSFDDVFELQDKIVLGTACVLDQSIVAAEIERSYRKPTNSLGAYDYYFRGLAALRRFTKESVDEAELLFAKATESDPNFAAAYGYASWCQIARKGQGWTSDRAWLSAEATRLAHLAWKADKDDALAIGIAGYALAYVAEDLDTGNAWIERALSNNANMASIWAFAAATKVYLCRFDEAIELAERAIRLSPRDSAIVLPRNAIAASLFCLGRYAEASSRALANLREYPHNVVTLRNAAASLAMSGDLGQARNIMTRLLESDPTLSQATLPERMGAYRNAKPKELYATALRLAGLPEGTPAPAPLPLPDRPSIAVLPFQNMSGDPEQEYFVDGLVEDIITALSRNKRLFVIARNSSFIYKGRAVDVRQVGQELGARYVLEGSVRKAGNQLRITGQLIEAESGAHLWAGRFDGALADVFDLQAKVALDVSGVVGVAVLEAEIRRATIKPTADLTAHDFLLQALDLLRRFERKPMLRALDLLGKAIERDPNFGHALAWAASTMANLVLRGWSEEPETVRREGLEFARRALLAAPDDANVLANVAGTLLLLGEDQKSARVMIDRATALNPSSPYSWFWSGFIRLAESPEAALEHFKIGLRLNPPTPIQPFYDGGMGGCLLLLKRFDEAVPLLLSARQQDPDYMTTGWFLASCYAHMGRLDDARSVIQQMGARGSPTMQPKTHFAEGEHREFLYEGLRLAGLPA